MHVHKTSALGRKAPVTCHIAPGHWAGHVRVYYRFCHTLSACGYAVHLLAHADQSRAVAPGVTLHILSGSYDSSLRWRLLHRVHRCQEAFRRALHIPADVYHFYSPEFIPWALRLRRRTGRPLLFDCMEDFQGVLVQRSNIPDLLRPFLIKLLRHFLTRAADTLDAITVPDAGTARAFRRGKARIVQVRNLPRLDLFPDPARPSGPKFDLVFHGGLNVKYLELILGIDAALIARGRRASWYLLGSMERPDWFMKELTVRNAWDRFTIDAMTPLEKVCERIRLARIGIIPLPRLPKYYSNVPQKLFEYMSQRMPVVVGDMPPVRQLFREGSCVAMAEAGNPDSYAKAIIRLMDNPRLCRAMGDEGRRRVERLYNWESESQKLVELYSRMDCHSSAFQTKALRPRGDPTHPFPYKP